MSKFSSKLIDRKEVAEETMAFQFEKPEDFTFKPGQHITLKLLDPPYTNEEGNSRTLSLVSAPYEDTVTVATRMRDSAFKKSLKEIPIGTEVEIADPRGSMTLHSNTEKPAVMLAGGIGITPFMSIIRHAVHEHLPHTLYLFYSNRTPDSSAFLNELQQASDAYENFTLIPTMTDLDDDSWQGHTGYIDKDMLSSYIADPTAPIYYMAGPPAMVSAMSDLLEEHEVLDDNIRSEEFSGY